MTRSAFRRTIRCAPALALVPILFASRAQAFNTKYHEELTTRALADAGFDESCPLGHDLVLASSWFADLYALDPASLALELHFDDLRSPDAVVQRWSNVGKVVDEKLDELVARKDAKGILMLLGLVLHGTQDFYAHSNWADIDWPKLGKRADVIYEEVPLRELMVVADEKGHPLHTGLWSLVPGKAALEGGESHADLNKDYAGRPHHEVALAMATRATARWLERFRKRLAHAPGLDLASLARLRDPATEKLAHAALAFGERLSKTVGSWDDSKAKPLEGVSLVQLKNELPSGDDLIVAWDGLMKSYARGLTGRGAEKGEDSGEHFRGTTTMVRAVAVRAFAGKAKLGGRSSGELGKMLGGVADEKILGETDDLLEKIGKSLEKLEKAKESGGPSSP